MLGVIFSNLYGLLLSYLQVLFPLQDLRRGKSGNKVTGEFNYSPFFLFYAHSETAFSPS